jgi:hypothetical protein
MRLWTANLSSFLTLWSEMKPPSWTSIMWRPQGVAKLGCLKSRCREEHVVCACARGVELHNVSRNNAVLFKERGTETVLSEVWLVSSYRLPLWEWDLSIESHCGRGCILLLLLLFMKFNCNSEVVVLTLAQIKQIRINIHKRNNTKTQYQQYETQ